MLCYSAFVPHSPLLIDSIGKENLKHLYQTRAAMAYLSDELYTSHPDVLFVISSHNLMHENAFSVNLHEKYLVEFREFGDHTTSKEFVPDLELITAIQREARERSVPFVLESQATLDYGSGVPLLLLGQDRIQTQIVPISYSGNDRKAHILFGKLLKEVIEKSTKRIAVIASGDLSHALSSNAPMGFHKQGELFDKMVIRAIEQLSVSQLLSFKESDLAHASECGLKPLLILFGLLERMQVRPEIRSYEAPFGVGYLVAQFHIL